MTDPHREELILRYITGKLPSDAALRARTYLDETPRGHVVGIGLRQVMAADLLENGAPDARTSLARLLDRLDHEIPNFPSKLADGVGTGRLTVELPQSAGTVRTEVRGWKQARLGPHPLPSKRWSVVAVLAVSIIVTVIGWIGGARQVRTRAAKEMLTYTTGNGERATITLPGGGTVALNVASRLDVPMDYIAGNHTLRLVGEGLFTIPHHDGTPVTVVAGTIRAEVLGTSFVVRRYTTDTAALVGVLDGKVAVGPTVVAAGQTARMGPDGVPQVGPAEVSLFTFATGVLTIDAVPISTAIIDLDRWFDADIRLGDPSLATQLLKGKYAAGSLGDLAEILDLTFNVRVVRDGRVLTLFPR